MLKSCNYCQVGASGNHETKCPYSTVFFAGTTYVPESGVALVRAEVLAACMKMAKDWGGTCGPSSKLSVEEFAKKYGHYDCLVHALQNLQPAAKDLEELLDKAHEAALPHAAEQLLKSLTEGGEFAVGSPLDKAKKRVEELLRKAELKGRISQLNDIKERSTDYLHGEHAWFRDVGPMALDQLIAGLEKARAIEGKG